MFSSRLYSILMLRYIVLTMVADSVCHTLFISMHAFLFSMSGIRKTEMLGERKGRETIANERIADIKGS